MELHDACQTSNLNKIEEILNDAVKKKLNIGKYIGYGIKAVCDTRMGFTKTCQKECDNFKCLELLFKVKNINLTHSFGILIACLENEKYEYVDYLIDRNEKLKLGIDFGRERGNYNFNALMQLDYTKNIIKC